MMLFLRKAWAWVSAHWYIPLGLAIALAAFALTRDKKALVDWAKQLASARDAHQAEVKILEAAHKEQLAADARVARRAREAEDQIRVEFERNQRELDATQAKRVKQIIRDLKHDPQGLADRLEKETGYRVVIVD